VSELLRRVLARDYRAIPRGEIRVILLEAGTRILPAMPERLSRAAASSLTALGVEVRTGAAVSSFDGTTLRLADRSSLPARTLVWAAGVKASILTSTLDVARHASGRVIVEPTLEVKGHADVYAIGDAAYLETPAGPVPMLAPPAMQMGSCAARNVMHRLADEPLEAFVYKDPGTMATIGRSAAVVALGRVQLRGFVAWLFWLFVHLMQLVGFRNKLVVLVDWAWQYFFYRPASTLILEGDDTRARGGSQPTLQDKELDKTHP
jgi:NADH dehydrogenase